MKTKLLLIIVKVAIMGGLHAQTLAPIQFGGWLALETQLLAIESLAPSDPTATSVGSGRTGSGPGGGAFVRWNFGSGFALQPELGLSTLRNRVWFQPDGAVDYRFTDLQCPLHLVWTNPAPGFPVRGSFLLGGRLGWNFARQAASDKLLLLREWVALDVGLGVEIRLKRCVLRPELLYAYALNNIHDYTNTIYDPLAGRVQRDRLSLRISCMPASLKAGTH